MCDAFIPKPSSARILAVGRNRGRVILAISGGAHSEPPRKDRAEVLHVVKAVISGEFNQWQRGAVAQCFRKAIQSMRPRVLQRRLAGHGFESALQMKRRESDASA